MGELCLRPLKVGDRTPDSDSLETFIKATKTLSSIPHSKVMELRKVLAMGDQSAGKILVIIFHIEGKRYLLSQEENMSKRSGLAARLLILT